MPAQQKGFGKKKWYSFEKISDLILLRCVKEIRSHTKNSGKCEVKFEKDLNIVKGNIPYSMFNNMKKPYSQMFVDCFKRLKAKNHEMGKHKVVTSGIAEE